MRKLKTIAILNQRRGVGKTTTTLALGMKLAERGMRVLLIDLDPQATLSAVCGVNDSKSGTMAGVLGGTLPGKIKMWDILRDVLPDHYCFLAPSDMALAHSELGLVFRMGRAGVLKEALDPLSNNFDVALIDCPPTLGLLTLNALRASQAVLIPTRPDLSYLRGICLLATTIGKVKREINPDIELLGVVTTPYNHAVANHRKAVSAIKAAGLHVLPEQNEDNVDSSRNEAYTRYASNQTSGDANTIIDLAEYIFEWLNGRNGNRPYHVPQTGILYQALERQLSMHD
jgi:chromosome partitioning protein